VTVRIGDDIRLVIASKLCRGELTYIGDARAPSVGSEEDSIGPRPSLASLEHQAAVG